MARILISEPHDEVRRMLERMLTRLGHEPLAVRMPTPQQLMSADVLVVEPAAPIGAVLAQAARIANPSLPLICASVAAVDPELAKLGVVFAVCLVKPFTAEQLGAAIDLATRRV
jgi:CheY-like chemotaxis protein